MRIRSSLGSTHVLKGGGDQISPASPSWFESEAMSMFRFIDIFSDEMDVNHFGAEEKFIPDLDVRNKDAGMDTLLAKLSLFNLNTLVDHARIWRMDGQEFGVVVLLNLAQSNVYVVEHYRRCRDGEQWIGEKVEGISAKQETGEAKFKLDLENLEKRHDEEISQVKLENNDLRKSVEELASAKTRFLSEGAWHLARYVHKCSEMEKDVAAMNNAISAVGLNVGVNGGYVHALYKKTPFGDVPLLTKDANQQSNQAIQEFDNLSFPFIESLVALVEELIPRIQKLLTSALKPREEQV
ncbi:hypothetical protein HanOQP8_Chr01g0009051 [Helianthus annuus]|nr:hypothetical protein HanOQP8_Chr01g0009051 [Helianthus annuus]